MRWVPVEKMKARLHLPRGIQARSLKRRDLAWLLHTLPTWYPGIVVGSESRFIQRSYYQRYFFCRPGEEKRSFYAILLLNRSKPIAFLAFCKEDAAKRISGVTGAIAPDFRGRGIANWGPRLVEAMGRAIGADLAFYYGSLQIHQTQLAAEKAGFHLVGIIPGFELDRGVNNREGRVFEAMYAKLLVSKKKLILPDRKTFTRRTRKVWRVLFPA